MGLAPDSAVGHKHGDLLQALAHLLHYDLLDLPQCARAELLARLCLQIHQAARRNPKAPDFSGTDVMTQSRLDSSGGVLTGDFAHFVAEEQKSEAFMMKQQRLYAEEQGKSAAQGPPAEGAAGKKK